jgi:hypothetical protein
VKCDFIVKEEYSDARHRKNGLLWGEWALNIRRDKVHCKKTINSIVWAVWKC